MDEEGKEVEAAASGPGSADGGGADSAAQLLELTFALQTAGAEAELIDGLMARWPDMGSSQQRKLFSVLQPCFTDPSRLLSMARQFKRAGLL